MLTKKTTGKWLRSRKGKHIAIANNEQIAKIVFHPRSDKENAYFAVFSINDETIEVRSRQEMNDVLCEFMNESDIVFSPF